MIGREGGRGGREGGMEGRREGRREGKKRLTSAANRRVALGPFSYELWGGRLKRVFSCMVVMWSNLEYTPR